MTQRSASPAQFVIERTYAAPVQRVFAAWAEPREKARWFGGPPESYHVLRREQDFRVGGREHLSGTFPGGREIDRRVAGTAPEGGVTTAFDATYHDIVPGERIVYAYTMHLGGVLISVSLATVQFRPEAGGTRMTYTEQAVFLDGHDTPRSRENGTRGLFDRLDAALADEPVAA